ncbi:MAG: hypothetical protein GX321_02820 [Clostridiales bacterium]|nr:hypothetical protein [Clostridiales bacterium]
MADISDNKKSKMINIDPRKLAILLEVVKEAEGKPMDKVLPILMNANKKMQDESLSFTKDESDYMMQLLSKNMSAKDRAQFDMLRKMMSMAKR